MERLVFGLSLGALLCLVGGPLAAYVGLLPPMLGMAIFVFSGVLGIGALASGTHVAIQHQAYFAAMIGMLGCLPFVAVTAGIVEALRHPAINDISTDLADPPGFVTAATLPENQGRDLAFSPDLAPVIRQYYGNLAPLHLDLTPDQAYRKARGLSQAKAFAWTITADDPTNFSFEAVATTRLFRWKDDLIVRIRPDGAQGAILDMRSKSREGKSDLGANERRIRKFLEAMGA